MEGGAEHRPTMATGAIEKPQESVFTPEDVPDHMRETKCLYCGLEIRRKRKGKKFCDAKHRWLFHNTVRETERNELKAFAEAINDLLEMHGLLRKRA